MHAILNCQKNTMVHAMRCELNLPNIRHKIREVNTVFAVRHLRTQSGKRLIYRLNVFRNRGVYHGQRKDYMAELVKSFRDYDISDTYNPSVQDVPHAPWEGKGCEVIIKQLP